MKCVICKQGETQPGMTTVIKNVPTDICENCGEYYLSDETAGKVLALAEEAMKHNQEVEVIQFAA